MATIRDVALRSGVSIGTVSNVLNNRTELVTVENQERVLKAVRDLGYRPRAVTRGDAGQQSSTIGVVIQSIGRHPLRDNAYLNLVLDGIISEASTRKFAVTILVEENIQDVRTHIRERLDGRCEGLILLGSAANLRIAEGLWERGIPFVQVGVYAMHDDSVSVDSDNVAGVRRGVEHLISLGHRRIAFLGDECISFSNERYRGYELALLGAGIEPDPAWHFPAYAGKECGELAADWWTEFPQESRPTAVQALADLNAIGFIERVQERGYCVPRDVSVIGFDDIPIAEYLTPALTTLRQPMTEIGRTAVEQLFQCIGGRKGQLRTLFQPELIIRGTTAAPPTHLESEPMEAPLS